MKPRLNLGAWGGVKRAVQPTGEYCSSVVVFSRGPEEGGIVAPELSVKGW